MNLKKRTKEEIDHSTDVDKDFTGGYEYLSWLIYMRRTEILCTIGLLVFGIICFCTLLSSYDPTFQIWAGVGAIIASITLNILLRRSYLQLKKGISS